MLRAAAFFLLSLSAVADEPLLVVATQSPLANQAAVEARYSALHYEIAKAGGLNTKIKFLPIRRARASYERGHVSAQAGSACGEKRHTPSLYTVPYTIYKRHLITAGDNDAISNLESLRGKTLGIIDRYFYNLPDPSTLKAMNVTLHRSPDHLSLVKLLATNRVDAMLSSAKISEDLRQHINLSSPFHFVPNKPFSTRTLCYVAQDNEKGKWLITQLNKGIRATHADGTLEKFTVAPFQVPPLALIKAEIAH